MLSGVYRCRPALVSAVLVTVLAGPRLAGQSGATAPKELAVAAASDLQAALPAVIARFQQDTGVTAKVSFGSSGNFFTQIDNGAPFDVFLSADIDYPRRLVASGR